MKKSFPLDEWFVILPGGPAHGSGVVTQFLCLWVKQGTAKFLLYCSSSQALPNHWMMKLLCSFPASLEKNDKVEVFFVLYADTEDFSEKAGEMFCFCSNRKGSQCSCLLRAPLSTFLDGGCSVWKTKWCLWILVLFHWPQDSSSISKTGIADEGGFLNNKADLCGEQGIWKPWELSIQNLDKFLHDGSAKLWMWLIFHLFYFLYLSAFLLSF